MLCINTDAPTTRTSILPRNPLLMTVSSNVSHSIAQRVALFALSLSLSSHTNRTILTSVCLVNSVSFVRIHLMFSLIYFIFPTLFVHISPAKMFPDREPIMILINGVEIYLNYTKIYLQRRTILLLTLHH